MMSPTPVSRSFAIIYLVARLLFEFLIFILELLIGLYANRKANLLVQQLSEHQRKRAIGKFDLLMWTYAKVLCNKIFCWKPLHLLAVVFIIFQNYYLLFCLFSIDWWLCFSVCIVLFSINHITNLILFFLLFFLLLVCY